MANKRCKTVRRRKSRYKLYRTISIIILAGLVLIGFVIGRVTKHPKTVTKTIETVKTVEIPVDTDTLPADYKVDYFNVPLSHSLQKYIYEVCADEDVPVSLVIAMIDCESGFNPEVASDTKDSGLMQINEINFSELSKKYHSADLLNPYQNVFCGIKIIGSYLKTYDNDYTKALMCYNMGEYGATKAWESGITSTDYTKNILSKWEEYKKRVK